MERKNQLKRTLVKYGKYKNLQLKDVPESYLIFCAENHKKTINNNNVLEYGKYLLSQKTKRLEKRSIYNKKIQHG